MTLYVKESFFPALAARDRVKGAQAWDIRRPFSYTVQACMLLKSLKGQCHEIFCFWFFSWISIPPAPEYPIRAVSNFLKIRGDIRNSRCTTGINDTGGKFATGANDTGSKFCHHFR